MDNLCDFVVRWAFCPAFRVRDRSPKGREGRWFPALGPLGGKIAARFRVKPGMTWEGRLQFYAARARPCAAGNATGIAQNDSEIPILREILQILPTILLFWANLLDIFSKKNYFP